MRVSGREFQGRYRMVAILFYAWRASREKIFSTRLVRKTKERRQRHDYFSDGFGDDLYCRDGG